MECESEYPMGYLSTSGLLIFYLCGLDHISCDWNMLLSGRSVVTPLDIVRAPPVLIGQSVDLGHRVMERETPEINFEKETCLIA